MLVLKPVGRFCVKHGSLQLAGLHQCISACKGRLESAFTQSLIKNHIAEANSCRQISHLQMKTFSTAYQFSSLLC